MAQSNLPHTPERDEVDGPWGPRLRVLSLRGNPIGDEGLRAIATAAWPGTLRELDLRSVIAESVGGTLETIESRLPEGAVFRRSE
jgi:hypothetical protein